MTWAHAYSKRRLIQEMQTLHSAASMQRCLTWELSVVWLQVIALLCMVWLYWLENYASEMLCTAQTELYYCFNPTQTLAEWTNFYHCHRPDNYRRPLTSHHHHHSHHSSHSNVPTSLDWRSKEKVTSVKNQVSQSLTQPHGNCWQRRPHVHTLWAVVSTKTDTCLRINGLPHGWNTECFARTFCKTFAVDVHTHIEQDMRCCNNVQSVCHSVLSYSLWHSHNCLSLIHTLLPSPVARRNIDAIHVTHFRLRLLLRVRTP